MKILVLGPLDVQNADGRVVTPPALKLRTLLAVLCVHADRVVSTQHLIDALWSGAPPRTAESALHVYVSKLRKHLVATGCRPGELATRSPGYALDLSAHLLDLREFDAMTVLAQHLEGAGRLEEASRTLECALSLWRGPALADMREMPVVDALARQLDERRLVASERRFELELALGRHTRLISELYGLTALHPLWENPYYYLMIALYRSGRTAECLMVYKQVRHALVDSLGMEPSSRFQRLHQAVLDRAAWLDDPAMLQATA
ncbi:AfsR/SARP family transcriptional regulator [Actinomycetes bacterium KLBMP 9759]